MTNKYIAKMLVKCRNDNKNVYLETYIISFTYWYKISGIQLAV